MNEVQRKNYLQAMGFEAYYVRAGLPFAAPGVDYDFPQADTTSELEEKISDAPVDQKPNQKLDDIRMSLRAPKSQKTADSVARAPRAQEPAPAAVLAPVEALRFTVQFYVIGGLAVLSEQPFEVTGSNASNQDQIQLLRNILLALGVAVEEADLRAETFNWPMQFAAASPTQSPDPADAAASALNGYLLQKSEQHGFTTLLAFAGVTEPLLQSLKENSNAVGFEFTVTSNLHAMLAVPALKRAVWEDIRGLRDVITAMKSHSGDEKS